jgi:hypothetical protein
VSAPRTGPVCGSPILGRHLGAGPKCRGGERCPGSPHGIATGDRHRGSAGGKPTPWPLTRAVVGVAAERAPTRQESGKERRTRGGEEGHLLKGRERSSLAAAGTPKGRLYKPSQTRRACRPPVPGPGSRALKIGLPQDARRDATSDGGLPRPSRTLGCRHKSLPDPRHPRSRVPAGIVEAGVAENPPSQPTLPCALAMLGVAACANFATASSDARMAGLL